MVAVVCFFSIFTSLSTAIVFSPPACSPYHQRGRTNNHDRNRRTIDICFSKTKSENRLSVEDKVDNHTCGN